MADDFYVSARAARFRPDRGRAESRAFADLADAKASADYETAGYAVQTLANLDAEARNLANLHEQYVRSQIRPPPEISAEEKAAKPWNRMTPDDALELARQSKYGKDLDWNDPHVRAGYQEAQRRRARGE